jgi:peptidoglycan/LPS O-acetylase OafA/YrhL
VLRAELPIGGLRRIGWLSGVVSVVNARAVTIYLWHFSMLIAALHLLGMADQVRTAGDNAELLAVVVGLTGAAALLLGWVEDIAARREPRLLPWPWATPRRPRPAPQPAIQPAP